MTHNGKALRSTAIAALALLALVPAAAQAGEFEADQYNVTMTGNSINGQHEIGFTQGFVLKCNATYHGEEFAATSAMHLTTGYNECTFGGFSTTLTFLNCHTLFTAGETQGSENTVAIETGFICEPGGSIEFDLKVCKIKIEPNQTFSGALAHNRTTEEEKGEIELTLAHSGLDYVSTGGIFCPISGGTYEDGTYQGTVTLEGEKPFSSSPKIGVRVT